MRRTAYDSPPSRGKLGLVPETKRELLELRQQVSQIDRELLTLIDRRARAARRIGELRARHPASLSLEDQTVLRDLVSRSSGDMPTQALHEIFGSIFAACLALELPVKVAFVGPEGGPAHLAARSRFGGDSLLRPADSPTAALTDVVQHAAEFAVVPLELSTEGPVHSALAALLESDLRIVQVIDGVADGGRTRIRHAVIATRPAGRTGNDLTFFAFGVRDAPGSLLDVLKVLAEREVSLTKIQSHTLSGESWRYAFCAEARGHFTDRGLVVAFEEIKRVVRFLKVLGSYPSP
jgi:chorismate mutase